MQLQPPFDLKWLGNAQAYFRRECRIDAADSVEWLFQHNSVETVIEAVREAWKVSPLRLNEWASRIDSVEVWLQHDGFRLTIQLLGEAGVVIEQGLPISAARLSTYLAAFSQPLPYLVRWIALTSPGLSLRRQGSLARPEDFVSRLSRIVQWSASVGAEEIRRLGFEYPEPDRHLMEVGHNGIGDSYVLGCNNVLYFFDHEAGGLVRCNVHLDELVEAYFENPERIIDPYCNEWAEEPKEQAPSCSPEPRRRVLNESLGILPHLAGLALAVRGCERAMPGQHLREMPVEWKASNAAILAVLDRCRNVIVGAGTLGPSDAKRGEQDTRQALRSWHSIPDQNDAVYFSDMLLFDALPALIKACRSVETPELVHAAVVHCSCILTERFVMTEASVCAAIADLEYLRSLDLGAPGTLGRQVPSEFFDRPLWPDGIVP